MAILQRGIPMHRFATVVLAAAVLSTAFLADADAGPFRHRWSCRPSSCGEDCQPANACGEAAFYVLYVCNGGSYQNVGLYLSWWKAHEAGMKWKTGKDALQYRPHANPAAPCDNKTFTIGGPDPDWVRIPVDLFECKFNVWTYIGTYATPDLASARAKSDLGLAAVEAPCPDQNPPQPGDYTICLIGGHTNGTPCTNHAPTPGAKQIEPKHP
jgi:hypothetical protein